MDYFSNLAVLTVPKWVKLTISMVLAVLTLLYLVAGLFGVLDPNRPGWIIAGAYILGILIPIFILVLVISFSETGVQALTAKTATYLSRTIPASTVLLLEPYGKFRSPESAKRKLPKTKTPVVKVQAASNMAVANYIIEVPPSNLIDQGTNSGVKVVLLRLELNATKLNMNLIFAKSMIESFHGMTETKSQIDDLDIKTVFPHTIEGSENEGYWFNSKMIPRHMNGQDYLAVVAVKRLADDFLINPILKLDLAQDLMLMIRAALNERPELFQSREDFYETVS